MLEQLCVWESARIVTLLKRGQTGSGEKKEDTLAFSCVTLWFLLIPRVCLKVAVSFSGLVTGVSQQNKENNQVTVGWRFSWSWCGCPLSISDKSAFHQSLCACGIFCTRDVVFLFLMWFLNFHVFHSIWICFTIISFIDIILSKFLRYEKPPLISTFSSSCVSVSHEGQRPCSPNDSFSFLTFFFPTSQSLFPYTHRPFPSPLPAQLCLPEMPLITIVCFLKQTLRPGQCRAAHFSAGLITVPSARLSGADQCPPDQPGTIDWRS